MKHLTLEQRYEIMGYKHAGYSIRRIAFLIHVSPSTISRELKKNSYMDTNSYYPKYAQEKMLQRRRLCAQNYKKSIPKSVFDTASELIKEYQFSPEQVVGYCKRKEIRMCSHERLYQWIWADKRNSGTLYKYLRHKGRRYRKRGSLNTRRGVITNRVGIEFRPGVIAERSRFGDFELDTIVGKNGRHILTMTDRATGIILMKKMKTALPEEAAIKINETLKPLSILNLLHSITSDNGVQFAKHQNDSSELKVAFYFARPYHAWERGTNENANGLIRQYIPKRSDFSLISDDDIQQIQLKLNNRPRKRYNYLSPYEQFKLLTGI